MNFDNTIDDVAQLEALYRPPSKRAAAKVTDRIDAESARFIRACRLVIISTGDGASHDASPRGGPAGFVQQLDDRHVALPDLNGNNLLDSFRNIVTTRSAGLLLIVPGRDETLRINGAAALTTDAAILAGFPAELRPPKVALVVRTDELYGHCAKAFRRGEVWDPAAWPGSDAVPDLAAILACQFQTDGDELRSALADIYERELTADRAET